MSFLNKLEAALGKAVHRANEPFWDVEFLPTGIHCVDHALGGGVGYGRLTELYGNWSSGKTMVLYYLLANNQRRGGISVLFESEGAFNADFYQSLGGDPEKLLVVPTDTVEDFFNQVNEICEARKKEKDSTKIAIGWDSIAATGTKHLLEAGMDKRDMSKAGAMSFGTQLITTAVKGSNIAIIGTNQVREKIGSMDTATHTPGGKAWPFHASQRIELAFDGGNKTSLIVNENNVEIGRWIKGQVTKNKLAAPFSKFTIPIYVLAGQSHPDFGYGVSLGIDLYEALFYFYLRKYMLHESGDPVVSHSGGAWYKLSEEIAPEGKKFMRKDWVAAVQEFPQLWQLPYARPTNNSEDSGDGSGDESLESDGTG